MMPLQPIEPTPRPRAAPARGTERAAEPSPPALLLLAPEGEPSGRAAVRAAESAGLRVRRTESPVALLHTLEEDAARLAAVLTVTATLPAGERPSWAARLGDRTAEAGLPLFLLDEEGPHATDGADPLDAVASLPHVTLLAAPPERVLTTVLRAARRERERRDRVCELVRRLEEAGRREQRLLARVGHELRNPLGAITSALTLMRETGSGEEPACRYRRLIERQVASLTRAVDELLEVSGEQVTRLSDDGNGDQSDERPAGGDDDDAPSDGLAVLLVEDDADSRRALGELLRVWGYDVRVAEDGEAGVEAAREAPPQVAMVDIGLPGIDGYEVARRIRRHHPEPPPLLIAMTGFGQPEDRKRALDAGFDLHLVKPIRPARLADLLRERRAG